MKKIILLFSLFQFTEVNIIAQQIVHFTKNTPATILIPEEFTLVYSTADGTLFKDRSMKSGIWKIYLGAEIKSLEHKYIPEVDKMENRQDRAEYASKDLWLLTSESFMTAEHTFLSFESGEYVIRSATPNKSYKSKDYFTSTEDFTYSLSFEFPPGSDSVKISQFIGRILHSFQPTIIPGESIQLLAFEDQQLSIPTLFNGWFRTYIPLDTFHDDLVINCFVFSQLSELGIIEEKDYLGPGSFEDNLGEIQMAELYTLRKIQVGDKTLYDVDCLVPKSGSNNCISRIGKQILLEMGTFGIDFNKKILDFK